MGGRAPRSPRRSASAIPRMVRSAPSGIGRRWPPSGSTGTTHRSSGTRRSMTGSHSVWSMTSPCPKTTGGPLPPESKTSIVPDGRRMGVVDTACSLPPLPGGQEELGAAAMNQPRHRPRRAHCAVRPCSADLLGDRQTGTETGVGSQAAERQPRHCQRRGWTRSGRGQSESRSSVPHVGQPATHAAHLGSAVLGMPTIYSLPGLRARVVRRPPASRRCRSTGCDRCRSDT